jgi:hypothetical protein
LNLIHQTVGLTRFIDSSATFTKLGKLPSRDSDLCVHRMIRHRTVGVFRGGELDHSVEIPHSAGSVSELFRLHGGTKDRRNVVTCITYMALRTHRSVRMLRVPDDEHRGERNCSEYNPYGSPHRAPSDDTAAHTPPMLQLCQKCLSGPAGSELPSHLP